MNYFEGLRGIYKSTTVIMLFVSVVGVYFVSLPTVQAQALSFITNSFFDTIDANQGNGICADANGFCSLRAAFNEVDATTIQP